MKIDQTSRTAQYMALFRALETTRKSTDRLYTDPYAVHFLDSNLRMTVKASRIPLLRKFIVRTIQKKIPGAFSSGIARTKYIDDLLVDTIKQGAQQVLILGAGFDTRALRLDALRQIPVIEIDHPNTAAYKQETFKNQNISLPASITYCQIDFNKQSLDQLAAQYNFDFTKPTTVIWEGVTNYLSAEAIDKTFAFISRFPKGSFVIFTYVHQLVLDKPASFLGAEKLLHDLEKIEERWTFGFWPEQLSGYLQRFNFSLLEDLGADEYREKYLPQRTQKGYEFYRVAIAKK